MWPKIEGVAAMLAILQHQNRDKIMQYVAKTLWTLGGAGLIAIVALLWQLNETTSENAINSKNSLALAAQAMETNKQTVTMLNELERRISTNTIEIAVAKALAAERHDKQ